MNRKLQSGLTIFGYFTAVGLLFFGYRHHRVRGESRAGVAAGTVYQRSADRRVDGGCCFPLVKRFARRFPIRGSTWPARLALHACALIVYSLVHTSLLWGSRDVLYPLFGLRHYDATASCSRALSDGILPRCDRVHVHGQHRVSSIVTFARRNWKESSLRRGWKISAFSFSRTFYSMR